MKRVKHPPHGLLVRNRIPFRASGRAHAGRVQQPPGCTMRTGIFLPVASFAPFSRTRTHLARDLLTRAPLCTPLLAAFAPLPTPLHTARLGLSL